MLSKPESFKSILENEILSFVFACSCFIMLPIHVQYMPPFMVLWGLSRILELNRTKINNDLLREYPFRLFALFIAFYLWQLVGLFYSVNKIPGLNNFLSRLSLFLFPFVLVIPGRRVLKNIELLLRIFAVSTAIFILCCFIYACFRSITFQNGSFLFNPHLPKEPWLSYFYGSYFSINQHPSYLSMYVIISLFIACESLFDKGLKAFKKIFWLAIGLVLLISIYFLSSRSGIICVIIFMPPYLLCKLIGRAKRKN